VERLCLGRLCLGRLRLEQLSMELTMPAAGVGP
jgi:hypothetical protein